jgi:hypothetical protein
MSVLGPPTPCPVAIGARPCSEPSKSGNGRDTAGVTTGTSGRLRQPTYIALLGSIFLAALGISLVIGGHLLLGLVIGGVGLVLAWSLRALRDHPSDAPSSTPTRSRTAPQ